MITLGELFYHWLANQNQGFFSGFFGILSSAKRLWIEWNDKELSLDVQEKQWPHLEEVLIPFTSDGNISDAKNIKLEKIEMISRNGFLWNTDVSLLSFLTQGRSTRDKLLALLYYQPVLQHRIELYVGLIDYLQRSFLTGVQKELRTGDDVITVRTVKSRP